ncbi:MAG: cell division protein FtsZ, partial [Xanthomonadales bacterium]|nr:cell division protein FtsZ [Xanthomonadales bacterium]
KDLGILTVAVVTKPFPFEGRKRMHVALQGIEELSQHVDSLITIPNEKLLTVLGRDVSLLNAFREANNVLLGAVQGIADLITRPGLINVDFADVRTVMSEMGLAMMGTGTAKGDDRAVAATEAAIGNPLLEDIDLKGGCGILVNITAGNNLTMREFDEVGRAIAEFASDDATTIIGTVFDPSLQDELRVTVVATGLNRQPQRQSDHGYGGLRNVRVVRGGADSSDSNPLRSPLRRPSVVPQAGHGQAGTAAPAQATTQAAAPITVGSAAVATQEDYLDIPTFLRRQAD